MRLFGNVTARKLCIAWQVDDRQRHLNAIWDRRDGMFILSVALNLFGYFRKCSFDRKLLDRQGTLIDLVHFVAFADESL